MRIRVSKLFGIGVALVLLALATRNNVEFGLAQACRPWDKTFGSRDYDEYGYSVQQTSDGGYILVGTTHDDVWLIKTDAIGNKQWDKTFGGSHYESGYAVQQTYDGGYIILGETTSFGGGGYDIWLVKTDASGSRQWDRTFGGRSDDKGRFVQQTSDGGYIIIGWTKSFGAGGHDVWLIKVDASGNKQWDKTLGGRNDDLGNSVRQASDGGYILVGWTNSFGAGKHDVWLIKYCP